MVSPHVQVGLSILSDLHFAVQNQIIMSISIYLTARIKRYMLDFHLRIKRRVYEYGLIRRKARIDKARCMYAFFDTDMVYNTYMNTLRALSIIDHYCDSPTNLKVPRTLYA